MLILSHASLSDKAAGQKAHSIYGEGRTTLGTLHYLYAAGRKAACFILGKNPARRKSGGWITPSLKTSEHAQWEV